MYVGIFFFVVVSNVDVFFNGVGFVFYIVEGEILVGVVILVESDFVVVIEFDF